MQTQAGERASENDNNNNNNNNNNTAASPTRNSENSNNNKYSRRRHRHYRHRYQRYQKHPLRPSLTRQATTTTSSSCQETRIRGLPSQRAVWRRCAVSDCVVSCVLGVQGMAWHGVVWPGRGMLLCRDRTETSG
jgi:hypothetical protein